MEKYIRDVFKDYLEEDNIKSAIVSNVSLYKKTNKLQVDVLSENQINVNEIENFENYLKDRFKVDRTLIEIKYKTENEFESNIENNWENIINYIGKKEPLTKAMLKTSKLKINSNKIDVLLNVKGSDFLNSKKFDKGLSHLLENLYNK